MSLVFPVIVYGNGNLFHEYFNAVVAAFGKGGHGSHFKALLHISILLAGFTVVYSFILRRDLMQMVKWLGIFYVAIYLLFLPEATVMVIDRVNGDAGYPVDHVPRGLAVLASFTSAIGDGLTRDLESNFTMPDYQPYHRSGMVFASRLVEATSQFEITDAKFDTNLKEFIHQCVFYDLLLKKYSINELVSSSNVWNFVSSNASPARAFIYDADVTTCRDGAGKLTKDWSDVIETTAQIYGKRLYPNQTKENAKAKFLIDLPISYQYLTRLSGTAEEILKQNLMGNAIQRGIVSMGAKLNAPAALESYAFARAQEQKRLTNKTLGDMAAYWLPLMKNAFEAIMYGSFIFIVLLSVFPFGWTILKNYIYTLLWIQIWAPLYAIINLIVSYYAQVHSGAAVDGALSLSAMSGILQVNSDMSGLAGYLTLSVPFLSAGLVKGMAMTLTHLSQSINGVTQSSGGAAASEASTGNFSFGNTSLSNHNAYNSQANHVDTSGRVSAGSLTTQLAGGSSLMLTPDGSQILDMRNSISNLGASVNIAKSLRSSYSQQAEQSETAALSNAHAYSAHTNAAAKETVELGKHLNKLSASGYNWSKSDSAGTGAAINENKALIQEFASRHNMTFDDAASLLSTAYAERKVSASIGTPGGGILPVSASLSGSIGESHTAGHNVSTTKGSLYSEAENYINNTNYSKNVDKVERAVKDHSFRLNDEEGKRLVENMGASLDKAESARVDMQSNLTEAKSARQMASFAEENAESININASQHLAEWMMKRPGTHGIGHLGARGAELMMKDPGHMQYYTKQYVEQHQSSITSDWHRGMAHTKDQITKQFAVNNQQIKGTTAAVNYYQNHKAVTVANSRQEGLVPNHTVDQSAVNQTENILHQNEMKIEEDKINLIKRGEHDLKQAKEDQLKK